MRSSGKCVRKTVRNPSSKSNTKTKKNKNNKTPDDLEKKPLHRILFPITPTEAKEDLKQLIETDLTIVKPKSNVGLKFINYYTSKERLRTLSKQHISFYDFWENRKTYRKKPYIQAFLSKYATIQSNNPKIWYRVFNLYYGSINIFKPIVAMKVYDQFKPTTIVDPTMGWGGRLLGAAALNIPNYIGIDSNMNLQTPYKQMTEEIKPISKTNIKLHFMDCLDFDYSSITYDMVFTSLPYYNKEIYTGTDRKTKKEWEHQFYIPIVEKTFSNLKRKGVYCLNIPIPLYEDIIVPIIGKSNLKIELSKSNRLKYKEYIYVWIKK